MIKKHKHFRKAQEAMRKDVERAFGVLQARFAIAWGPVRFWYKDVLAKIMTYCVILHNMVFEDERDMPSPWIMKMLAHPSRLACTQTAFKHILRRVERLRPGLP